MQATQLSSTSLLAGSGVKDKEQGKTHTTSIVEEELEACMNTYSAATRALPLLSLLLGLSNNLLGPSWEKYLIQRDISPSQQTILSMVISKFPWNLKIFVAFVSDIAPICGRRRKPYLLMGLALQMASWGCLALHPSVGFPVLCSQQFLALLGEMVTSVVCDTLVVEAMRWEMQNGSQIGKLQASCWMWSAMAHLAGTVASGWLSEYGGLSFVWLFALAAMSKGIVAAYAVLRVRDTGGHMRGELPTLRQLCQDVWRTITLLRVLRPVLFVFFYACLPGLGGAFSTYLLQDQHLCVWSSGCLSTVVQPDGSIADSYADFCAQRAKGDCETAWGGLGFHPSVFAYIGIVSSVGLVLGTWVFKRFFLETNWCLLFAMVTVPACAVSSLQLLLMFRDPETGETFSAQSHIPNVVFAMGDDALGSVLRQLLLMPILVLMAGLCPKGAEGTVYALVTSIQCVGATVAGTLSNQLIEAFHVTNTDFSALWQLTLLTSALKLLGIPLLLLVWGIETGGDERKHRGGGILLAVLFLGGLSWALTQVILEVSGS